MSQHHEVQVISQLLVLLDGLEARGRVAVVATTNRLEAIDPAVRRPGRFDCHIEIPQPERAGRVAILRIHLPKMRRLRHGRLVEDLAARTEGFSGAELAALCRAAGLNAIQRGLAQGTPARRLVVSAQDFREALEAAQAQRLPTGPERTPQRRPACSTISTNRCK